MSVAIERANADQKPLLIDIVGLGAMLAEHIRLAHDLEIRSSGGDSCSPCRMISASASSTPSTTARAPGGSSPPGSRSTPRPSPNCSDSGARPARSSPGPTAAASPPPSIDDALERLRELVEETPDATLETLKQKMGVSGSRMIICRALQKLGLPLKKKSPHASERDTPEVQEERREFAEEVEPIEPSGLSSWTRPGSRRR